MEAAELDGASPFVRISQYPVRLPQGTVTPAHLALVDDLMRVFSAQYAQTLNHSAAEAESQSTRQSQAGDEDAEFALADSNLSFSIRKELNRLLCYVAISVAQKDVVLSGYSALDILACSLYLTQCLTPNSELCEIELLTRTMYFSDIQDALSALCSMPLAREPSGNRFDRIASRAAWIGESLATLNVPSSVLEGRSERRAQLDAWLVSAQDDADSTTLAKFKPEFDEMRISSMWSSLTECHLRLRMMRCMVLAQANGREVGRSEKLVQVIKEKEWMRSPSTRRPFAIVDGPNGKVLRGELWSSTSWQWKHVDAAVLLE